MLQLFFLSISLNALAGVSLLAGLSEDRMAQIREFLHKAAFRFGLGVATAAVGFLKFIVRSPLDEAVFLGDLLPAVAGLAAGTALLADVYMTRREGTETAIRLQKVLKYARIPVGAISIGASVLHFAFSHLSPF